MQKLKEFVLYTKKYLSIEDSYAILANAKELGITERLMVETAGAGISENLGRKHRNHRITVVCGHGGNGAIGMATARHLVDVADVNVVFVGDPSTIRNESASFNYKVLESEMDIDILDNENIGKLKGILKKSDDVVDSLIGVGLRGRLDNLLLSAIKEINASGKYIVSIDVPSGINANTGIKNLDAVKPDIVFAVHKMKKFLDSSNVHYSVVIIPTGIPPTVELMTGPGDVMLATKPRFISTNKYEHGTVLVLGGSVDYKGAPLLSGMAAENALAALKLGSGYVTVMSPEDSLASGQRLIPELILKTLSKDSFGNEDMKKVLSEKHDVLVIGPGLSQNYISYKNLSKLLLEEKKAGRFIVADAGMLQTLSRYKNIIGSGMVLTPHIGEFKHLSGIDYSKRDRDSRINGAIDFAKTYECTLVLKGNETIITDGNRLKVNKSATPTLATMGTGDVLSGIIASYIAINKGSLFESSAAGVYVHSKTGDKLYEEMGLHATAYEVANSIPKVVKEFDRISY